MKLVYAAQACADLDSISDYLNTKSPAGARRVAASLQRSIDRLRRHPFSGRQQDAPDVRKIVEPKYRYLIFYAVAADKDEVVVLSVLHPARERAYEDL